MNLRPRAGTGCVLLFERSYYSQLTALLVSFAGLFYFSLYLCSKFAIRIPYLLRYSTRPNEESIRNSLHYNDPEKEGTPPQSCSTTRDTVREEAAAPPTYLIVLPLIPLCAALYKSSTRYSDFKHHGFDIISGSAIGIVVSWLSFRMYHLPVGRGAGWAWRPRSAQKAYGIGIGALGYVDGNNQHKKSDDPEIGPNPNGRTGNLAGPT